MSATQGWLDVLIALVPVLQVDAPKAAAACSDDIYAAHQAYRLAEGGMPFRDAYKQVAREIEAGSFKPDRVALTAGHLGGAGNLGLELIEADVQATEHWLVRIRAHLDSCEKNLWNQPVGGKTK
ncbi:MAG: hypothetical protein ACHQAZ_06165 [Gammaproteobacteria bacterium]